MKSPSESLRPAQVTPLVSLLAIVATILAGMVVYQKFSSSGAPEIGPLLMGLALAIPAAIFGGIFLQVRAADRAKKLAQSAHARMTDTEIESRILLDHRRSSRPHLDNPLPDNDPFENL